MMHSCVGLRRGPLGWRVSPILETRRAIALNPNDPQNLGPLGTLMAASLG